MSNVSDFTAIFVEQHLGAAVETYQSFHAAPELSMQENRTAERIDETLRGLGIETFRCGGTGVVGILRNGEGPTVAYRADIDGLPITEDTGLPYASKATGTLADGTTVDVMHGCGHDTHITVGLALARLLATGTDSWAGTVVFVFQPGEETAAGAKAMLADGLWAKAPTPEAIYGQHVWPGIAGTVDVSIGTAMALADSRRIVVHGRQAHGSQPQDSIDPIVLMSHMIVRLQTIVSREVAPSKMAVLTVGSVRGGLKENIIPDRAEFTLNLRTFDPEVRAQVLAAIRRILFAEAAASGAKEPEMFLINSFPRCYNDPALTEDFVSDLRGELGAEAVRVTDPVSGSEDFGALGDAIDVPSVFWFFGAYGEDRFADGATPPGNHSPFFAPDEVETALTTGVRAGLTALLGHVGR